jgi:hypothetical protein
MGDHVFRFGVAHIGVNIDISIDVHVRVHVDVNIDVNVHVDVNIDVSVHVGVYIAPRRITKDVRIEITKKRLCHSNSAAAFMPPPRH